MFNHDLVLTLCVGMHTVVTSIDRVAMGMSTDRYECDCQGEHVDLYCVGTKTCAPFTSI